MQTINRSQARKFAFDWEDEPLLRVACGEVFEIQTMLTQYRVDPRFVASAALPPKGMVQRVFKRCDFR